MAVSVPAAIAGDSALPPLRIGDWCVIPAANELTRKGETVRLEPKTMEVLVFLADRAGQVVSREALLSAVWPGAVVGDDALTQAVIKLRKSLRDTTRSPQYIETISKRGYRLIAPVERRGTEKGMPPEPARQIDPASPVRNHARFAPRTTRIAALLVLLLVVGSASYVSREHTELIDIKASFPEDTAEHWTALPTVSVKPFETVGDDGAQTYLARGIASDLMTDLSRLSGLRVVSSQTLRQGEPGSKALTKPTARYLISGTVQHQAESLRINVRLIDTESGRQLWAERYDRTFRDLISVQAEIVGRLLQLLPVQVSEAERRRVARRYTHNLEAYEHYLRGKATYLARRPADNVAARQMFQSAIERDPSFARAYASLALTHADDYRNQWTTDGRSSLAKALQQAQTALRMDPDLAEVYGVLAYIHAVRLEYKEAIKLLKRAVELDRSYADAYAYMGAFHTHMGQPAEAIPLVRFAIRLNPDAGFIYFVILGRAYLFQGDVDQASVNLREALARNPADLEAHVYMAATLVAAKDLSAARWEAEEIRTLQPDFTARRWLQTYPMIDSRQKQRLTSLLAQVGL
jgi:DNA-binding winged helix-turn-helix (wHTH) protein/TolB-like protein